MTPCILTALAIAKAGSTDGPKIREGFYAIDSYDGLIKTYEKPFTPRQPRCAVGRATTSGRSFVDDEILPLTQ